MKKMDLTRVPTQRLPPGYGRFEGSRYAVGPAVRRAERRGEVRRVTEMTEVNPATGKVCVTVETLKDPAPRWRKPAIIASAVLATLVGVAWAGYLIAAATASIVESSGPIILGFVLLGGLVLVLARPDRIIEGTFRARIRG